MNYPFECPNCGYKETISMPMAEYKASGHMCEKCNAEMRRDPKSITCGMSIDKTGDFYRRVN